MVSVSGIRGVVGDTLLPETICRYTSAFAAWCRGKQPGPVVVGRDGRPSGRMLLDLVKGTLSASGLDTIDLGVATTPGTAMAVAAQGAVGGIVLTASHNPAPWNALKFLDARGNFLSPDNGRQVLEIEKHGRFAWQPWDGLGTYSRFKGADQYHVDAILALDCVDSEAVASRSLRVVVDAVNASGSKSMPLLVRSLGAEVVELYCDGSGEFPHDPEPKPANLSELSEAVRREGAQLGLAVDPDSDRLVLVDETGLVLSEEYTLALAADYYLGREKGAVAANLSTSRLVDDVAARHGVPCHRSPVGEAHVVAAMEEHDAVIGGEGNGGVILPSLHAGRDGLVGSALIMSAMATSGQPLSALAAALPSYSMEKRRVELRELVDPDQLKTFLREQLDGEIDDRDGVRCDMDEGWLHIRPSNTEAILRLIGESDDAAWLAGHLDRLERSLSSHLG